MTPKKTAPTTTQEHAPDARTADHVSGQSRIDTKFYRKPGKLAATTQDVWVSTIMRRTGCSERDAEQQVSDMIGDGRLTPSED